MKILTFFNRFQRDTLFKRYFKAHGGHRSYHVKDIFGAMKPFASKKLNEFVINRVITNDQNNSYISQLVDEFRAKGHFLASINPLTNYRKEDYIVDNQTELLNHLIDIYKDDLTEINSSDYIYSDLGRCTLSSFTSTLAKVYCSNVGVEFMHISDIGEREWLACEWEKVALDHESSVSDHEKVNMAELVLKSELYDKFVGLKFPTVKRYSGEGAESMLVSLDTILRKACTEFQIRSAVIGMPHRGRLNTLDLILGFPAALAFRKMSGLAEFDLSRVPSCTGDVLSHLFITNKRAYECDQSSNVESESNKITVSLLPNPSHLETVAPVVCGKARSKAMRAKDGPYGVENRASLVLPIQIHGDASFIGQGVTMEALSMSKVPNFTVNGSIHIIVNNQLGYTTPAHVGRSSAYCSDVLKMIDGPCIHVNGDSIYDVIKASKLALKYRQTFGKDVALDIVCFRRWGHNELDDPTYTNPLMYKEIHSRSQTMPELVANHVLGSEKVKKIKDEYQGYLNDQFKQRETYSPANPDLEGVWSTCSYPSRDSISTWNTGVPLDVLLHVGRQSVTIPDNFVVHPNLKKVFINDRLNRLSGRQPIDWATAEALALGSLLYQSYNVRISGQDVGRGTFSQRHAMLVDQETGKLLIPLNGLNRGSLEIANSILSEYAVLGFEYGFAIDSPNNLAIWEAQFGDFFNGAQIVFDTLISSGERKWLLQCGMIILLPHGYDGAGPEHSSCRIERFLQMTDSRASVPDCDDINWHVCNATTPAQYFHLIRRQMMRNYRKPLILASPKLLLRHSSCMSSLDEFLESKHFRPVLPDPKELDQEKVTRIIFCSGKHFYMLDEERKRCNLNNVAIIRLEELCPFPVKQISDLVKQYPVAKEFIWSQEEQRNMGAWSFVEPRFLNLLGIKLNYVGRSELATPVTAISSQFREDEQRVLKESFAWIRSF